MSAHLVMPRALFVVLAALTIGACATRTQTFVVIDGDAVVRAETTSLEVEVRGDDDSVVRRATLEPGTRDAALPLSIALEPRGGDARRRFTVHAFARRADGSTITEAHARSGYVSGRALSLRLFLSSRCAGVTCDETTTCRDGICAPLFVAPETLPDHPDTRFDAGLEDTGAEDARLVVIDASSDAAGGPDSALDTSGDAAPNDAAASDTAASDAAELDAGTDASDIDAGEPPRIVGVLSAPSVEEGSAVDYTLTLSETPSADVTVTLGTDVAQLTLTPSVVTFAAGTSTPQVVRATPVWDPVREAPHPVQTITHVATSTAPRYDALPIADVTLDIIDQLHVELISVNAAGDDASRVGAETGVVARDGRYVVFQSRSNDLVAPLEAGTSRDVYVRDLMLGTTTRFSSTGSGAEPDADSGCPSVSDDGSTLVFYSDATNIEGGRPGTFAVDRSAPTAVLTRLPLIGCGLLSRNGRAFVQDTQAAFPGHLADAGAFDSAYADLTTGMVTQASVNGMGQDVRFFWGDNVFYSHVSANARFVVFSTPGDNLDASDPGDVSVHNFHAYVRDMTARTTTRISRHHAGRATCAGTYESTGSVGSRVSNDGVVYFNSECDLRVDPASGADNTLRFGDVFSRDPVAQITRRVVRPVSGVRPDRSVQILSISDTSTTRVLVQSEATNLVAPTVPPGLHTFVIDPATGGPPRLATFDREGTAVVIENGQADLSGDGRFVVFTTRAAIDPRDTNGAPDVYLAQLE